MNKITEFKGEFAFLSNFAPSEMVWDNMLWPTAEHAYQSAKTLDRRSRLNIANLATPAQAKRAGKTLVLRPDWETYKYGIMEDIVRAKFIQNYDLAVKLLGTGDAILEEGNTWHDRIWGVCPPGSGNGTNWLGLILMDIRKDLRG